MNQELRDLLSEIELLEAEVAEKKQHVRQMAIEEAQKLIDGLGIAMNELRFEQPAQKKAKRKSVAKYRHPEKPELKWAGRGRQPKWVTEYLRQSGKTLDDLRC